jgi:hypothetical protein
LRGIESTENDFANVYGYFAEGRQFLAYPFGEIPCADRGISAKIEVSESLFPGAKTIQDLDGVILLVKNHYFVASTDRVEFDSTRVKRMNPKKAEAVPESAPEKEIETMPQNEKPMLEVVPPVAEVTPITEQVTPMTEPLSPAIEHEAATENIIALPSHLTEEVEMEAETSPTEEFPEIPTDPLPVDAMEPVMAMEASDAMDPVSKEIPASFPRNDSIDYTADEEAILASCEVDAKADAPSVDPAPTQEKESARPDNKNVYQSPFPTARYVGNDEIIRKIKHAELSILPRKYWNLANNSFLMHGYHNYHHLLLVQKDDHFWVGVPGIYATREAKAADLFGFPQFTQAYNDCLTLTNDERDEHENFGYWCRYLK